MPFITIFSVPFLFWTTYKRVKALITVITPWFPFIMDCTWFIATLLPSIEYYLALWENLFVFDGMLKIIDFKQGPANKFAPKRPVVPSRPKDDDDEKDDKPRDKKKNKKDWRDNLKQFYKDHQTAIYFSLGVVIVAAGLLYAYHAGWWPKGGDGSDDEAEKPPTEAELRWKRREAADAQRSNFKRRCYEQTVVLEQLANTPEMRNFWLAVAGAATILPVWRKPVDWVWTSLKEVFGVMGDSVRAGSLFMAKFVLIDPGQARNTVVSNIEVKSTPSQAEKLNLPWDPTSSFPKPSWRREVYDYKEHIATGWLSEATGIPVEQLIELTTESFGDAVEAAYARFYQNPQVREAVLHLIDLLDKAYYKCKYPK